MDDVINYQYHIKVHLLCIKQRILIGTNDFTEISLHVFYVKSCFQKATVLSKDVNFHLCNIQT